MTRNERPLVHLQPNPAAIPAPLRFYDPELQNASNAEPFDEARYRAAQAKATRLHAAYLKQIDSLRPRLAQRTYVRFADRKQPLFDSNLLEFTIGDAIWRMPTRNHWRPKTRAAAKFLSFDFKLTHSLTYRGVDSLRFDVPSDRWFDSSDPQNRNIDNLLHDELASHGRDFMQHRFLFVSGATIAITFRQVIWTASRGTTAMRARRLVVQNQ